MNIIMLTIGEVKSQLKKNKLSFARFVEFISIEKLPSYFLANKNGETMYLEDDLKEFIRIGSLYE